MTGPSRLHRRPSAWAVALLASLLAQSSTASGQPPPSKTALKTETTGTASSTLGPSGLLNWVFQGGGAHVVGTNCQLLPGYALLCGGEG